VKGSIITTKTWLLLIGAALLISAGLLNFRQRVKHETPPWDGVEWVDQNGHIIAKSIEQNSSAAISANEPPNLLGHPTFLVLMAWTFPVCALTRNCWSPFSGGPTTTCAASTRRSSFS